MDAVRLGLSIRALRRRRTWTQEQLARRSGTSRSTIQRIERGGADAVPGRVLRQVGQALGARVETRILWQGEALDRLLDADHAALVDRVIGWLRSEGWDAVPEATFAVAGERGSVDVLAFHPATGALLVVEVKTVVPDMQALLAGIDRKGRLASAIARERGWAPRFVGRLLVLPEQRTARRRVLDHAATLDAALPDRNVAVRRWVRAPDGPLRGLLFLSDAGVVGARHRVRPGRTGIAA